uniref:Eukaryotic translation initiation factor 2-alpha kinase 1 n=1 Tax=Astatotilapia calliptera TaxID=8154 RepID=A0AAX7U0Y1_ASTCA
MDIGERNIVEIIAKVIEEGKTAVSEIYSVNFTEQSAAFTSAYLISFSVFFFLFVLCLASDTDDNREVLMAGRHYPSIQEFASAIPNHLLLGSLLEHLCFVYESNPARSRMLFKVIGQRLAAMNLLSPLAISDEFSTVRLQHNRAFTELLNAASSSLYPQGLGTNAHNPSLRPKEGLFQAQTSRYLSEFEEICRLGKGSYGNVFKVMNKLDGQYYAMKKILIKKVSKEDCMKVLREVKMLSSLQHVNVVGYHTAWMEHVQPAACEYFNSVLHMFAWKKCMMGPLMETLCVNYMKVEMSNRSFFFFFIAKKKSRGCNFSVMAYLQVHFHLMLYIQMQLCERSLKDWISERNAKPKEEQISRCPYACIDTEHTLRLLRHILEGVEYIHSNGIMHRDLKPRNIFLHGHDCHVRIGDFGLACRDIIADGLKNCSHTSGVGTFVYAAPEQLKGSNYNSKSDMYSIGVLALELFQPFGTEMERVRTLGDLREGKIPDSFCHRWPVLTKYIMNLTDKEPSVRPTASQLLQSELFCSKDKVIHGLQRRVEEQEEEIMQLRRRITQLQTSQLTVNFSELENT